MDPLVSIIIHARNDVQHCASRSIIWSACAVSRQQKLLSPRRVTRRRLKMLWLAAQLSYGLPIRRARLL